MERKGEWLELRLPRKLVDSVDAGGADSDEQRELFVRDAIGMPESYYRKLLGKRDIRLNGDRLSIRLFAARPAGFPAEWHPVDIVHEDDYCLVANKPAGLAVHPSEVGKTGTLANAIAWHYESTGQQIAVRHIHRLDEWTSGLVLYAKNEFAQQMLDEQMRKKAIQRIYLAMVQGIPPSTFGMIDAPIGKDRHRSGMRRVSPSGDRAVTHYEVVETFKQASLLRVRLETGRTHQIRVHLRHIGLPIIGDPLYGMVDPRINRQALHGQSLTFCHPIQSEQIRIECDLPDDMSKLASLL